MNLRGKLLKAFRRLIRHRPASRFRAVANGIGLGTLGQGQSPGGESPRDQIRSRNARVV
jgi:hypothetical protein